MSHDTHCQLVVYVYKQFVYRVYGANLKTLKVLNAENKTYDNHMFYICFVYTMYIRLVGESAPSYLANLTPNTIYLPA